MALRANRFRLGMFFVLIMGGFIASIFWLAGGFSSKASTDYACYFGWSVGGLNVGSSVNYNGVPVGSVSAIEIAPDGRLVKVVLTIEDEKFRVDDTIVASLYITGITGLRNVNLESLPDSSGRLWTQSQLSFQSDLPVIPVQSGTMQSVTTGLNRVFEILEQVDAKTLNDQAILALTRINRILETIECDSLSCRVTGTLNRIDTLLVTYNHLGLELTEAVAGIEGDMEPLMEDIHEFTSRLSELSALMEYLADDLEDTFNETGVILHEFSILLPRVNRMLEGFSAGTYGEDVWR
ncbi:MAG TPA: MlaD family protein [Candidatus Sabulitectum sp.]|nr:MlaD family protein [Candidatus Sabulitectum sp.]HPF33323.1 MlaD family protein [Candidatus Sabulitectum sp.]HPJ28036.1 MlaD family protein [Candidatus Sabulitectum sp.]HPR21222.1 MlaD family protein [Candidatus Sabulitectum sp.]